MVAIQTLFQALYYASVLSVLSVGITLAYMTTNVFNFAHIRFAMVASYVAATVILLLVDATNLQWVPGTALPFWIYIVTAIIAGLIGSLVALTQYYLILKPLERRGASGLTMMISTLGFDFILVAILFIYSSAPWALHLAEAASDNLAGFRVDFSRIRLDTLDARITVGGVALRAAVIEAVILAVVATIGIALMLRKTAIGVMMRSAIENPHLALVLGVNVDRVFAVAWFIAGFLAGLAGYLFLFGASYLKYITPTSPSDEIIVSAFAGAIVGGIRSPSGSIGGGFLIGLVEKLFVPWLAAVTGFSGLIKYDKVFSMLAVALTLLFIPQGLASITQTEFYKKLVRGRGGK